MGATAMGVVYSATMPAVAANSSTYRELAIFGVAEGTAANGAEVVLKLTGVFDLPKAPSQAWTTGAAIYWDATEARCTTVGTGNRLIGAAAHAFHQGWRPTTSAV